MALEEKITGLREDLVEFMITPQATEMLKKYREQENLPLRIAALGSCCGPRFNLYFDEERPSDITLKNGDLSIVFDKISFAAARQGVLDYVKTDHGEGFIITPRSPECSSCTYQG